MELIIKLIAAGGIMGILDFIWLGFVAKKLYYDELGKLLLDKPNMVPAILFYVIFVVGTIVFAVNPALEKNSWQLAFGLGALLGFMCYATYDLTNLATMKGFSTKIVVIDLLWGAFIAATVSVGTFFIVKWLTA